VLAAEATAREGDFTYRNDALIPARDVPREDADRTVYSIYGRGAWHGDGQQVHLTGWLSRAERGLPGPANAAPGGARQWDDFARLWLTSRHRRSWGTVHLRALGQHTRMRYANPASGARDTSRTQTLALDAEADRVVGSRWLLAAGAEAGYDRADLRGGIDRARLATFVRGTGLYGRWEWTPALRLDVLGGAQPVTALSPRLDVRVQPLAWDGLHLKAGAGRSFRAPTFNEQFWEPGGNPDLTAEQGWSAEVGTHVAVGGPRAGADAEVTVFTTRIDDQVVWYPSYVGPGVQVWRPDNFSRVVTRGLEASLQGQVRATPDVRLRGGLFYTLTDAENRSNPVARAYAKQLRYVPREQLKLHGSLGWRVVRLDVSGRLVSRRYLTSDETDALPAYQVVDAQLRLQHALGGADVTLALALENALDADYAIISRYPMPPRHAHIRLTVAL
jgi:iron complex outermembrane receptor protein